MSKFKSLWKWWIRTKPMYGLNPFYSPSLHLIKLCREARRHPGER